MGRSGLVRLAGLMVRSSMAAIALVVAAGPAVLAGLVAAPVAGRVAAQDLGGSAWATRSAEVEVDLTDGDGRADVVVRYRLGAREPDGPLPLTEPVPVELLDFGDVATEEIVLDGRGRLVLWPTVGSHRAALVEPPLPGMEVGPVAEGGPETGGGRGAEGGVEAGSGRGVEGGSEAGSGSQDAGGFEGDAGVVTLTFRYSVAGAVTFDEEGIALRARVPVLAGPAVLTETGGTAFRATLDVPPGWSVTEGFPSGIVQAEDGRWVVTLPVVPSVVGFRGRTDGAWRPGFPLLLDVLTVLILVGFGGVGWRHLRRVAA